MKNSIIISYALCMAAALLLTACKKEIDFDYHEIDPIVVIEGRVTNEGTTVMITKSRNVTDSVRGHCLTGAVVTISGGGIDEVIAYDSQAQCYHSSLKGKVGESYRLTVDFEGHHYEGIATMPAAAPILHSEFLWFTMLEERIVVYELWAADPNSDERNYYWFRMDRLTHHPHFKDKKYQEPYTWNVFDNRGCPPGLLYRDVMCMSERMAEEDKEENWDYILYEGDSIICQLMSIDRATYDYFASLRAGQGNGANPRSNLTGGCLGYFTAGSVTRADTLVFRYDAVKPKATFIP